jgi:uncharacterized protein YgbK (DUF1537 family)
MQIGAIADDMTGATDLALMLSRGGLRTVQVVGVPDAATDIGAAEAVVVALKSRTAPVADAVAQSVAAARWLLANGAAQLFFKYCSTFDSTDAGNIGPVADALMDLVGAPVTIACPAFPANKRTVYKGHLFVGDVLLSDSPMRDHPLTPMRDANLVRVLARQSRHAVTLIDRDTVARGAAAVAQALAGRAGIAIVDAITDDDLRTIGRAVAALKLVTGGSGVALGLPDNVLPAGGRGDAAAAVAVAPGGAVTLAGSCSAATRRQVAVALAAGAPALQLDPLAIADGRQTVAAAADFVVAAQQAPAGAPPLVYSSADPAAVAAVQARLGRAEAGDLVERFLADLAARLAATGCNRFVVAGGETSGAVVAALGVTALDIGREIAPGVPWTLARGARPLALALKSGNFGGESFFADAWALLGEAGR